MPFGANTVITISGYGITANRIQNTPTVAAPRYVAIGTGATGANRTAAATDTALSNEVETRALGSESQVTITNTGDTYQVVGVVTATASRTVDEAGLFNSGTSSTPTMFLSATISPTISLLINDSLQLTCQAQLT